MYPEPCESSWHLNTVSITPSQQSSITLKTDIFYAQLLVSSLRNRSPPTDAPGTTFLLGVPLCQHWSEKNPAVTSSNRIYESSGPYFFFHVIPETFNSPIMREKKYLRFFAELLLASPKHMTVYTNESIILIQSKQYNSIAILQPFCFQR
jgi:hypothetical protein